MPPPLRRAGLLDHAPLTLRLRGRDAAPMSSAVLLRDAGRQTEPQVVGLVAAHEIRLLHLSVARDILGRAGQMAGLTGGEDVDGLLD